MAPSYLRLKATVMLIRAISRLTRKWPAPAPDHVLHIKARDGHGIKVHVYEPREMTQEQKQTARVVINMHGSGFVLPCHGESDAFARRIADEANVIVYDVAYRLAPEWPFPHAYEDVEDVLSYLATNLSPQSRLVLSGFSAGGNLALTVSSNAPIDLRNKVDAVITFYPADLSTPFGTRIAPEAPKDAPYSLGIPHKFQKLFNDAYLGLSNQVEWLNDGGDFTRPSVKKDPRMSMSSTQEQIEAMPDTVVVFTGGRDSLVPEMENFVEQLRTARTRAQASGQQGPSERKIVYKMFEGRDHAWDINMNKTGDSEARDEAYGAVVDILKQLR
ncbi:hypothetical protein OIV83_003599 [Microbotryomycetes sp. JL201]|nr:hypothetical protein OIV83_003599 [Microbotryomycetes sp. JL201]